MTKSLSPSAKYLATGLMVALMSAPAVMAQGGNDPIPGIDIIIKRDPGSQPIAPGGFGEKEIGLTYDAGAEKLNARLIELTGRTFARNDLRDRGWTRYMPITAKSLSEQISEGQEGASSFTYPSADGRSKMTVTIKIRGGEEMGRDGWQKGKAAPAMQKMDADTYGSTRSNRTTGSGITAPEPGGTPEMGDVQSRAISYGTTRSNTRSITAPDFEMPDTDDVQDRANINTSRSNRKNNTITAPEGSGGLDRLEETPTLPATKPQEGVVDYFDDQDRLSRKTGSAEGKKAKPKN